MMVIVITLIALILLIFIIVFVDSSYRLPVVFFYHSIICSLFIVLQSFHYEY